MIFYFHGLVEFLSTKNNLDATIFTKAKLVPDLSFESILLLVDIRSTEWRVDRKKNDDWPKKFLIKFLYVL